MTSSLCLRSMHSFYTMSVSHLAEFFFDHGWGWLVFRNPLDFSKSISLFGNCWKWIPSDLKDTFCFLRGDVLNVSSWDVSCEMTKFARNIETRVGSAIFWRNDFEKELGESGCVKTIFVSTCADLSNRKVIWWQLWWACWWRSPCTFHGGSPEITKTSGRCHLTLKKNFGLVAGDGFRDRGFLWWLDLNMDRVFPKCIMFWDVEAPIRTGSWDQSKMLSMPQRGTPCTFKIQIVPAAKTSEH